MPESEEDRRYLERTHRRSCARSRSYCLALRIPSDCLKSFCCKSSRVAHARRANIPMRSWRSIVRTSTASRVFTSTCKSCLGLELSVSSTPLTFVHTRHVQETVINSPSTQPRCIDGDCSAEIPTWAIRVRPVGTRCQPAWLVTHARACLGCADTCGIRCVPRCDPAGDLGNEHQHVSLPQHTMRNHHREGRSRISTTAASLVRVGNRWPASVDGSAGTS